MLDKLISALKKELDFDAVMVGQTALHGVIPTGSIALDKAIGVGGYPIGRVCEIFGSESCLDADTFIYYELRTTDGKRQNSKGGTIERLYNRFHGVSIPGSGNYHRKKTENSEYYVSSINENNAVFKNKIVDVVKTGKKDCWKLTSDKGFEIIASAEHKFYNGLEYIELQKLSVGDVVYVHKNYPKIGRAKRTYYKEVYVKYHPHWKSRTVSGYLYYRCNVSRAAYEANLNGLSYEQYINILNTETPEYINTLKFAPVNMHIHHIDRDINNNLPENLMLVNNIEHGIIHTKDQRYVDNLAFIAVEDKIKSIEYIGPRETYDIKCLYPYNNYIANNFVVHNSGKSTMCIQAAIMAQMMNKAVVYIDAEYSFQPEYAKRLGLSMESDNFLLAQPDTAEEGLGIIEIAVQDENVGLVILDSVAAMVPTKESFGEGEIGDSHVGLVARLMTQFNRRITPLMKNKSQCVLLMINQVRENIGGGPYSSLQTPGGRALKHGMAIRVKLARKTKDTDSGSIGVIAQVVKNKVAMPYQEAEFIIRVGSGVDLSQELANLLVERKAIKKSGSWYKDSDGNVIGQGANSVGEWIINNQETVTAILKENDISELYVQRFNKARDQELSGS